MAIFTTESFEATTVDVLTVRFGLRSIGSKVTLGVLSIAAAFIVIGAVLSAAERHPGSSEARGKALEEYVKLPVIFIPNVGQADPRVRYYVQGSGYRFGFTSSGALFDFVKGTQGTLLELQFVGASPNAGPAGERQGSGKVNYLIGNDPAQWRTNLPTYEEIVYHDIWPGIDLIFRGVGHRLKYEFEVRPQVNPSDIRLLYRGARTLSLNPEGHLLITTALGVLRDERPVSYQDIGGRRVPVDSRFVVDERGYGFEIGTYDSTHPLVIDPELDYSTLLGGAGADWGRGVAVDASGSAIVTGLTTSGAAGPFPTSPGAHDELLDGTQDAFVTKLDPTGSTLVFSTYLGGSASDGGLAVAVDASNNVFVTGATASANFPTTVGTFGTPFGGSNDVFLTKFSPSGSLLSSTHFGGVGDDQALGLTVDGFGNPIVTGQAAPGFPTSLLAYDPLFNGGLDVFVAKLSGTLSTLMFSTFVGASGTDVGEAVALDAMDNPIVTGRTNSSLFPTSPGAYSTTINGGQDAFVTKLDSTGSILIFSTFLGGTGQDDGHAVAVDALNSPVIAGDTRSTDFPANANDTSYNGGLFDAFVTKLNPSGTGLVFSTFLGGAASDQAFGLALDSSARPVASGTTSSVGFPTTTGAYDTTYNGAGDVFVTKLAATGSSLVYSTFLGGSSVDTGSALALDASGIAYLTGMTFPFGLVPFPTTPTAFDTTANGSSDAFVTKLTTVGAPYLLTLEPATDTNEVDNPHTVTATVTDFGGQPVAGVTVRFAVTGVNARTGSAVTDANGQASFTYTGILAGTDTIDGFADTNGNGTQNVGEPSDDATKTWTPPPSTAGCRVNFGGSIIIANGARATFDGSVRVSGSQVRGPITYQDHGASGIHVEAVTLSALTCTADSQDASIFGIAAIDGSGMYAFRINVTDLGSPGSGDTFEIILSSGYMSGEQPLAGGDIRIRQ